MKALPAILLSLFSLGTLVADAGAATVFPQGSTWRWRPGATEASTPVEAWRSLNFNDASFTEAPATFYYGEPVTGGTLISGMQNNYLSIFLRKTFVITDPSQVAGLRLGAIVDDGFVAWINGTEVQRVNMTAAPAAVTISTLADNAVEPVSFTTYTLANPAGYLVPGTNVIAVQVFQSALSSSDLLFDASLESILVETVPPTVAGVNPAAGTVTNLTQIAVTFSEQVSGVDALDLRVNGLGAAAVTTTDNVTYTFSFVQPPYGNVDITWAAGANIADTALPPNPFNPAGPGATWSYTLNDRTAPNVASLTPAAGAGVRTLTSVLVTFTEPVNGVNASDLLINGTGAAGVTVVAPNQFTFNFPAPATGTVQVAWAAGHGITDQASVPNAFAGGSWTYLFDPNAADASPYISEFMASNTRTLADETGEFNDWIEIYNPGTLAVNLEGWSLTDAAGNLTKWKFPATNLAGGGFLVVFASGYDRRVPGARLHTSFLLSAGGEYLALVRPDGRIASDFRPVFPPQSPDVSYGLAQFGNGSLFTAGTNGVYFTRPTPGAANIGGATTPGPIIEAVTHTPNVPLDHQDLTVTARVVPSFNPVGTVSMRYRIMFSNEVTVPMFDDGAHGDGAAGDRVYGATIPANLSTNGQMIRYAISATDANSNPSRWPVFLTTTNHAEYLGTIVNPTNVTSKLPIYHLFISTTALPAIDTEAGGRGALFYDGELYDNISFEIRGNTSVSQNKKSHRVEFNREHPFRHLPGYPRVRKTSLMAEHLDPAYLRQHLCFWFLNLMGVPSPFHYPVRAQLNGSFYALVFHNDVIDEEQIERLGWDPRGAIYKAVGVATPGQFSTGVFQKKTDPLNDTSDYQTLVRAINETNTLANRRVAVFDMMDVPEVVNYLAGARWCSENDDVWANMSLYRDTYGDRLWRCVPFDMNASWGQRYGGVPVLEGTNDAMKSHPLYGSSSGSTSDGPAAPNYYNRVYDVIIQVPETRQMLLRRQRTLLDKWAFEQNVDPQSRLLESHIKHMTNLMWDEAFLDRAKWGFSTWNGTSKYITNAVDELWTQFINPRRIHWSAYHNSTNTARPIGLTPTSNAGIPPTQPPNAALQVHSVEFNPSSGLQNQEFVAVTNPTTLALEVSGWKVSGGVNFTFKPGTIVPANSVIYVSPDVVAFKARTTGPRGGQGLFVVGPYTGQLSARGESLTILNDRDQVVNSYTYPGSPSAVQQYLRVTEIMYHPSAHPAATDPDEFEYIELRNTSGSVTLNLAGVRFVNGIDFSFTGSAVTNLPPGARVLVVKNPTAFSARYGGGLPVAGSYTGFLDNSGERVVLVDASNEEVLDFSYNNSWYRTTDGLGFSLVVVDEAALPDQWGHREQWRPSGTVGGGPGVTDPNAPVIAPVVISEALTHTDLPSVDQIELHNPTASPVNVGGWWLSDDFYQPKKFLIPAGRTIPAGGYMAFSETEFNAVGSPTSFALSSDGDELYLYSGDGSNLTGYYDGYSFGAAANGVSFGRYVTSQTNAFFVAQSAATIGGPNAGPKVGPVVISEINYRPLDLPGDVDNNVDEFVELSNITGAPVRLYDQAASTNTWRLRGGVDFDFPSGVTLPANSQALLVSFSPADTALLSAFRARYSVPSSVPIFGPYSGQLDNSSERLRLFQPDPPNPTGVPYVLVDEVEYASTAPWPSAPDGVGPTLQRIVASSFGNDVTNWTGVGPSAGAPYVPGGTRPVVVNNPSSLIAVAGRTAQFSVTVSGTAPLFYQWRFNGKNIYGANSSILVLSPVTPEQAGEYSCVIFNSGGSADSTAATLTVLYPPTITLNPSDARVHIKPDSLAAPTTNATFTAGATSSSTLRYQWLFNGEPIAGATSPSYTVVNVQQKDFGQYACAITDDIDTVVTTSATLFPLIRPSIMTHPVSQSVAAGSRFGLSVAFAGFPPPYTTEWRLVSTPIGNTITTGTNDVFSLLASPVVGAVNNYRGVVRNAAGGPGAPSNFASITSVADSDLDGIPDTVETALGLNPNNGADGAGDLDGDQMSNRDEYLAGTDPQNAASYLKIEQTTVPGTVTILVAAVANRSYSVQYTDNLANGAWTKLGNVVARPTDRVETLVDRNWTTSRFYRIALPGQ